MTEVLHYSYEDLRKKADEFLMGFCMGIDYCAFGKNLTGIIKCDRKEAG